MNEWRARPSGAMERVTASPDATVERWGDVTLRVDLDSDGDWVANVTAGLAGGVFIGEDYFDSEDEALDWGRIVAQDAAR